MRITRNSLIFGFIILSITLSIVYYFRLKEKFYTPYTLSASDANDSQACEQCITVHQNDQANLCTCLKNNGCIADIATYCGRSAGKLSDCDTCSVNYAKCFTDHGDYKKCRSDLCDCLKKFNCDQNFINETCSALPTPSDNKITSCVPSDGIWSKDGVLQSPCCQPPDFQLDPSYKTCQNYDEETDPNIKNCLETCCKAATDNRAAFMDPSFIPLSICGCSLCCNSPNINHFKKYGSCDRYIYADKAIAETPDIAESGSNGNWRGYIGWNS